MIPEKMLELIILKDLSYGKISFEYDKYNYQDITNRFKALVKEFLEPFKKDSSQK